MSESSYQQMQTLIKEQAAEIKRLKELCDKQKEYYERIDAIGYDAICADLMDEIAKIKAAPPQKESK